MGNSKIDTSLLDKATIFATKAHEGDERRGHGFPYLVHLMEACAVCSTITADQEILAAAILHDAVEDTDVTVEDIRAEFGDRIAEMVGNESEAPMEGSLESTWHARKQRAINHLASVGRDSKIVAMGDKLSNMRSIALDFKNQGDVFWNTFHTTDPYEHEWHYRGLAESLEELADTDAYQEFVRLIDETFLVACKDMRLDYDDDANLEVCGWIDDENVEVLVAHLSMDYPTVMNWARCGQVSDSAVEALVAARKQGFEFSVVNATDAIVLQFYKAGADEFIEIEGK